MIFVFAILCFVLMFTLSLCTTYITDSEKITVSKISNRNIVKAGISMAKRVLNYGRQTTPRKKLALTVSAVLSTGTILMILLTDFNVYFQIRAIIVCIILTAAAITDFIVKRISNKLIAMGVILRTIIFIPEIFYYGEMFKYNLLNSLIGLIVCLILLMLLSMATKGGIGMGDVKLISLIGYMSGLGTTFYTFFFGMIICMLFSVCLLITHKLHRKDKIAFGPFLAMGYMGTILLYLF